MKKEKQKLNSDQIRLLQTAVRAAGIRTPGFDGRYRILLSQYKKSDGVRVTTCRDLNPWQLEDLLAICESMGWRHPGKSDTYYRDRIAASVVNSDLASFAQTEAIRLLAGDLGMTPENLNTFIERMTETYCLEGITAGDAWKITEALIAMLSRRDGKPYKTIADVKKEYHHRETEDRRQKTEAY